MESNFNMEAHTFAPVKNNTAVEKKERIRSKKTKSLTDVNSNLDERLLTRNKRKAKSVKLEEVDKVAPLETVRVNMNEVVVDRIVQSASSVDVMKVEKIGCTKRVQHQSPYEVWDESDEAFKFAVIQWAEQHGY